MVTIKLLEVRLEVEGTEYEQEFARLFNQAMDKFQRLAAEDQWVQRMSEHERGLGDQDNLGGGS